MFILLNKLPIPQSLLSNGGTAENAEMILLVFATEIEAEAFIDYHDLKKQDKSEFYDLYERGNISLIITGMGSMRGALSLSDLIKQETKEGNRIARIINYGIAGCLSDKFSIGAVVEIDKVIKYDPVEFSRPKPGKLFLSSFPDIIINEKRGDLNILATSDHPIFIEEDSKKVARYANFVDMEGYGYAFVAKYYNIPIRLLKGISDFVFKQSEESFIQNVKTCLEKLLSFHRSNKTYL